MKTILIEPKEYLTEEEQAEPRRPLVAAAVAMLILLGLAFWVGFLAGAAAARLLNGGGQ